MEAPGFFARLSLALRVLGDATLAARVVEVERGGPPPAPTPPPQLAPPEPPKAEPPPPAPVEKPKTPAEEHAAALHLLSILQRDGRFVDFLQEDVGSASDGDVGAAARIVHAGCRKAMASYFSLVPVRKEGEGARVTVDKGFDPVQIRLAGNVTGEPPFKGTLVHAGWRAAEVKMPTRPDTDPTILAPAEVEL